MFGDEIELGLLNWMVCFLRFIGYCNKVKFDFNFLEVL